jgi:hypothetical protein
VWTVSTADGPLQVRPGEPAPAPLRLAGIVTAFNPASRPLSSDVNRAADRALRARIEARGLPARRSVARASSGDDAAWDEPGWCVTGDVRDPLVALGAELGQNAIVWITATGDVTIVCTRNGFCGGRIGDILELDDG